MSVGGAQWVWMRMAVRFMATGEKMLHRLIVGHYSVAL